VIEIKIKNKRKITKYTLKKASEHIYYEVLMFNQTLELLIQKKPQIEINILLDSFAIHARNLLDFFYPKDSARIDDLLVFDFIDKLFYYNRNKTKKKELIFISRKVDKQVAHLTYTRNRYNQNTKAWPFVDISRKINKTLKAFYYSLPDSYKNWRYFQELKKVIDLLNL